MDSLIRSDSIERRIFIIRGHKVMLTTDLAKLYNVPVKALVQAVKRNRERFPSDFLFQLARKEYEILKSQLVTSRWGGIQRAIPHALTQGGVAMFSDALRGLGEAVRIDTIIPRCPP